MLKFKIFHNVCTFRTGFMSRQKYCKPQPTIKKLDKTVGKSKNVAPIKTSFCYSKLFIQYVSWKYVPMCDKAFTPYEILIENGVELNANPCISLN